MSDTVDIPIERRKELLEKELHILAREVAEKLEDPDKKQLKFNDIVEVAIRFYNDPKEGVVELVQACCKTSDMYTTRKDPMWLTLRTQYSWM